MSQDISGTIALNYSTLLSCCAELEELRKHTVVQSQVELGNYLSINMNIYKQLCLSF